MGVLSSLVGSAVKAVVLAASHYAAHTVLHYEPTAVSVLVLVEAFILFLI